MQPAFQKLFAMVLSLIGPAPSDTPKELQLKPGDQIVAIGDSITAAGGYLKEIDAVLASNYPDLKLPKVINKGISGQKAEDLVRRFDADVVKRKPAFVTISIGINDVWHRLGAPHDAKVLAAYKKNVATMVDRAQQAGIKVILLAPTVIQENPNAEGNKRLVQYVEALKQIAAEKNKSEKKCQFVDLHGMFLAALKHKPASEKGNWLTGDGVHMKPLGDGIMAAGVLRALGVPDEKLSGGKKTTADTLIPRPVSMEAGEGSITITAGTVIVADSASSATAGQLSAYLAPAIGWTLPLAASQEPAETTIALTHDTSLADLGGEGYLLEVTPQRITLKAPTQAGLFYAVQTLRQLFSPQIYAVKATSFAIPCVKIKDYPRFEWRGLMLDSGHDFQNLTYVLRYIDAMAAHKFNVFHWHLTDLGTWSIEIKKYPKLLAASTRGKGVKPGFYTQDEIRQVVKYAAERHITVVPEIDMPGHSVPALLAYPELNCPVKGGRVWQYCIGNEKTFDFLEDVLAEAVELFPSTYFHIGGDECPKDRWHQCPLCQARMKAEHLKNEQELQSYFVKRIEKFLNSKGRRLIGWDEILEGGLAPNASVMSWRGMGGGIAAAKSGHGVVMAPTSHVYFDNPDTTVAKVYSFEPVPKELDPRQAERVLGAEAEMWSDNHPSEETIDGLVYPRACALAEVVWSPASARNEGDFLQRMTFHQLRLAEMGLHYRPLSKAAGRKP